MNEKKDPLTSGERPKTRLLKAAELPKSGMVVVEKGGGETTYRCPCDRCETVEEVRFQPKQNRPFLCRTCMDIDRFGKPTTRHTLRRGEILYNTQCDRCERVQETRFLPNKNRLFLCDECMRQEPSTKKKTVREVKLKKGVRKQGDPQNPSFQAPCDRCGARIQLNFAPRERDPLLCLTCHQKEGERERKRKTRPDTRLLVNLECVSCGKHEVVDFVPSSPDAALCATCFDKKYGRKKNG